MGRLAHALHAAGQHPGGLAERDHLGRGHHRLVARAAQPVDGEGGDLLRHPGLERHVPRPVERVARGLERVAHHDVVDGPGLDARPLQGPARRHGTQVDG